MTETPEFLYEMEPFEGVSSEASRIVGVGGAQPASEEGYAFRTEHIGAPAGFIAFVIEFAELRATRGTLWIELLCGDPTDRRQIKLRTIGLADFAARGGREVISHFSEHPNGYTVAGYVYDDTDARAESLTVRLEASKRPLTGSSDVHDVVKVARLAAIDLPSFEHPTSQSFSASQLREKSFRAVCGAMHLDVSAESWPAAFVFQLLRRRVPNLSGLRGFGAGASAHLIAQPLAAAGAEVSETVETRHSEWPVLAELDFIWLILEEKPLDHRGLLETAEAMVQKLRVGGLGILIFPFEHSRMPTEQSAGARRGDVEVIALKLLAQGNTVSQLKFRVANQPLAPGVTSPFSLVFQRMV